MVMSGKVSTIKHMVSIRSIPGIIMTSPPSAASTDIGLSFTNVLIIYLSLLYTCLICHSGWLSVSLEASRDVEVLLPQIQKCFLWVNSMLVQYVVWGVSPLCHSALTWITRLCSAWLLGMQEEDVATALLRPRSTVAPDHGASWVCLPPSGISTLSHTLMATPGMKNGTPVLIAMIYLHYLTILFSHFWC